MVDIICINITDTHIFECQTDTIARSGEASTPILQITFPKRFVDHWPYLDFKKPNGETFRSPRLDTDGNVALFPMPLYLLDTDGTLEVQFISQDESGLVWKTYTKKFNVKYSINAVEDIPEKEDFIATAQKALDDVNETIETLRKEGVTGAVLFNVEQELNDAQKACARGNIDAYDMPIIVNGNAEEGYTSRVSYDDMVNALNHGRTLWCVLDGWRIPFVEQIDNDLLFVCTIGSLAISVVVSKDGNDTTVNVEFIEQKIVIGDTAWDGMDNNVVDFTEEVQRLIDENSGSQADAIDQISDDLQSLNKELDDAFSSVNGELQTLSEKVGEVDTISEDLQSFKQDTTTAIANAEIELQSLNTATDELSAKLQSLNTATDELSAKVDEIGDRPWTSIEDVTLQSNYTYFETELREQYTELYIECVFSIYTEAAAKTIYIRTGNGTDVTAVTGSISSVANGDIVHYRANGKISPSGKYVFETAAGKTYNTSNVTINCGDADGYVVDSFAGMKLRLRTSDTNNFLLGAGTTIKIWGR